MYRLAILNLCLISAIMTLGVNIQWGYAGIVNFGMMGFAALGGVAAVLVSMPPVTAGWEAGGLGIMGGLLAADYRSDLILACFMEAAGKPVAQAVLDNCADCGCWLHRIAPAD